MPTTSFIQLPLDTANTGKKIDTRTTTTAAQLREVVILGDGSTDAGIAPVDVTYGLSVDVTRMVAGTGATSLGKAEDAAHTSGDTGVQMLAVRNDAGTALAGTTGDYIPLSTDANGALRVVGSSATTQYAEDAAHASGDSVVFMGAIRRDTTPTSSSGTAGDYSALNVDANGRLYVQAALYDAAGAALTAATDYTHDAALTVATTAGPAMMFRATSAADAVVTDQDAVLGLATLTGKQIVMPYSTPAQTWSYAGAAGGLVTTGGVTIKAAGAAGVRNYVTSASGINSHQTISTEVIINDGAAGTALWRGWAQCIGGGFAVKFDPPLRGSAATLVEVKEITATGTAGVVFSAQGYSAAE